MTQVAKRKLKAKTSSSRGFTLVELLVTMLILLLASMMVVAGIPAAQRAYASAVDAANAESMLTIVTQSLRDELEVADPATVTVDPFGDCFAKFRSMRSGRWVYLSNKEDGIYVAETITDSSSEVPADAIETLLIPRRVGAGAGKSRLVARLTGSPVISFSDGVFTVEGTLEIVSPASGGSDDTTLVSIDGGTIGIRTIAAT